VQKTIAVGVVVLAVVAAAGGRARAADPRTEAAREHSRQGDAYYKLEKYTNAIGEYEQAYLSKPDPSFLFNIAQCHRLMGHNAEAVKFYRRFLSDAPPSSPSRGVAEKHIRDLEDASKTATTTAPTAPPSTAPAPITPLPPANPAPLPPPTGVGATAPVALEATSPTSPSTTTPVVESSGSAPSDDQKPFYYKWWFWTAVGAVVASGLVIGVVASGHDPACPEMTICR
jgi:tetratricopeptide (TPR) repeat protein